MGGGLPIRQTVRKMDMFLTPLPAFNLNGKQVLRTACGGIVTFVIVYTTFMFASLKFTHLVNRYNPQVNSYVNRNAFDYGDEFEMGSQQFRMAFAVERHATRENIHDLRYLKWYAAGIHWREGHGKQVVEIPMHPCDEDDYE